MVVGNLELLFVSSAPFGNQVNVGADPMGTIANLLLKINEASGGHLDTMCTAQSEDAVLTLTANDVGSAGNSIPLSSNSLDITITPFSGGSD